MPQPQVRTLAFAADEQPEDEPLGLAHCGRDWWTVHRGLSPVIGTAIHNGHAIGDDALPLMALSDKERLREEDPFTEFVTRDLANRIVCHRSRFEIDLNRGRDGAVYLKPEQAWGLTVWREAPAEDLLNAVLAFHDDYYAMLEATLRHMERRHGRFVLLDMHSYNHRRGGRGAAPAAQAETPDINIGTFSMDRQRWAHVVDPFIEHLRQADFLGRRLDVRENVAFQGRGEQTRFVHHHFPETGCAIAIEFKKIFMDEWTGTPDRAALAALRAMIRDAVPLLEAQLKAAS